MSKNRLDSKMIRVHLKINKFTVKMLRACCAHALWRLNREETNNQL